MIEIVCGSCRYYANEQCHVEPPRAVLTAFRDEQWRRPHVEPTDLGCANFWSDADAQET